MTLASFGDNDPNLPPPWGEPNGKGASPAAPPFLHLYSLVIGLLVGVAFGLLVGRFWLFRPAPLVLEIPTPAPWPPTATPAPLQAYITGAVAQPGVYTLPVGSRVAALVTAAGGFLEGADQRQVNLAQRVTDGMEMYVPVQGEEIAPARASRTPTPEVTFPVDINLAPTKVLEAIPGIGPATAQRIVEARPYGEVDDLLRVKGIGRDVGQDPGICHGRGMSAFKTAHADMGLLAD